MKYILIFILFITNIYAFVTTNITKNPNLIALNYLDINPSFIKDKNTNHLFNIYSKRKKRYFLNILKNASSYIPLIKKEINKAQIPSNIIFVAMAESYFSSTAKSNKKAIGLWQFMPDTAKRFGLKINTYIDERRDPIKSTIAAIKYLSLLKKQTGKWYLAIMAYNCGEARVVEAVTRAKLDLYCKSHKCKKSKQIKKLRTLIKEYQKDHRKFSKLYYAFKKSNKLYPKNLKLENLLRVQKGLKRQYLPKETRKYIRKIIAMNFLLNSDNFVKYNNHYLLNRGSVSNLIKVNVPAGTSLGYISKFLNIDYSILRKTNLHLKYGFTPPNEDSYIYIPYNKLALFRMQFNNKNIAKKIIYKVKTGDSLNKIAKNFKINYKIIKDFNHLKTSLLRVNQTLVIPIRHNIKIPKIITYRVKKGDSLNKIARIYHTKIKKIQKLNNLTNYIIHPNQKLSIPTYITMR
jgi:membrane-bound lytic murein transglycosylase D